MLLRIALVGLGILTVLILLAWFGRASSQPSAEALHDAAHNGALNRVRSLVEAGAEVNARSELGRTESDGEGGSARVVGQNPDGSITLHVTNSPHIVVKSLFGRTVYDNGVRLWDRGSTPLQVALGVGENEVAGYLLTVGAEVNVKSESGTTPLITAVYSGSTNVIEKLLASGADVDAPCDTGETPLHGAVHNNRPEVVELLLEAGAHATARDEDGRSPLDLCRFLGHDHLAEMLERHLSGAKSNYVSKE